MAKDMVGIEICGIPILKGENKTVELLSATLYTHTNISVPIHVYSGKKEGPCLLVTAAIHGNELNGVEIINQLTTKVNLTKLRGTLILIPIMNVFGLLNMSRYLPDRRDLNRCFPGSKKGSLAARLAHLYTHEVLVKCTHLIDLHTGGLHRENFPQIRTDLTVTKNLEFAKAFSSPVIVNASTKDGSFRSTGKKYNIPTLVYEAGEALRFNESAIRVGLEGIMNCMQYLKMLPSRVASDKQPVIAKSMKWIRAPQGGVFYPTKALGDKINKKDTIGIITDPFGQNKKSIIAHKEGIVIGMTNLPLVNEGDGLFNIGYLK